MTDDIFVYEMTDDEFWAGRSAEEVLAAFVEEYGDDGTTGLNNPIVPLSFDEMRDYRMWVGEPTDSPTITFREHLDVLLANGQTFPTLFCGTEW